ncbi:TetR family transcriptional regulator [Mycolicibacterium mageritense DSM 44476 = CIP 104973]|uniref:TetR family transcriptional regulator n=1 Tax=Mycolicibacterium mageritense TaxID=53462 RepID=A0ABM7HT74_MYCME|nr:TetR/AcrR family transcriptional regulator [Mycolicibacterium mageritense]MBN3458353.1 TetR/AcrR family transcriptional regulator [Mycobacterium sp. DSM 3803]OKH79981.1 TetR family transcriptional regulator [Mycobacterium sp. SWH-M3]MCC9182895.1 TetR/AcrR family transcriptional regulator [Mycolicibacterium mageritense]CDO22194.1 TetR family transcriptional regulator [Mycolicibacterium mageritense DSM 44476 = CIP 104973]BBX33769.1 TetR family transcriptional regulator [Mycolicibacterium mage
MGITRAGRPRLITQRRPGSTARDEILDAAGELFTTLGYTRTSTRTIAEAVGIRQASLYHYFRTKDDILCALLSQTVQPTLSFIPSLCRADPALTDAEHLHALALFDGRQLLSGRWNLGALYLQPEVREARLSTFWADRERLRLHYLALSKTIVAASGVHDAAADLPFRLVESLVNMWSTPEGRRSELPGHVADACLRVLGLPDHTIPRLRYRSCALLSGDDDEG